MGALTPWHLQWLRQLGDVEGDPTATEPVAQPIAAPAAAGRPQDEPLKEIADRIDGKVTTGTHRPCYYP
jgi:hypothetical protein